MSLNGKNAVVYGGGGTIGGACAEAFARAGARVFLAGRTAARLEAVAARIEAAGGRAETAVLDATDEQQVDEHADEVARSAGSLDISMNVIQHGDVQGTPMAEMAVEDYLQPVATAVRTSFLTWRAAARNMAGSGGGVILVFGGSGPAMRGYSLGGLQVAFEAMESMRRQLSTELGPQGVRVVTLRSGGIAESFPAGFDGREQLVASLDAMTLRGRAATLWEVGETAAFCASDAAAAMTGATINVSAGALIDY
ncbi:SDR family oxidoreductase [Conexibacter sp. JD483]|uniref:SDR family NAD(P)-dependent oxidoreductase n=1 Tax=unclassified Conexibacter TaxID=2627773 RepID=UPI00271D19BC|nr:MULTISPECIES: SDR family oxidoreductase [unclassified Conexibacter]MDO8189295.1 SDR family oxidoreductase [Conexibacter sp. CPCC 205706]MDO8201751.1 SDR family oxidoreductase [Conexibacter sp. CPCC 205762]MDR9372359.1 SDR family oxidoreductase [Conexibacter sp. JD483]